MLPGQEIHNPGIDILQLILVHGVHLSVDDCFLQSPSEKPVRRLALKSIQLAWPVPRPREGDLV